MMAPKSVRDFESINREQVEDWKARAHEAYEAGDQERIDKLNDEAQESGYPDGWISVVEYNK